MPLVIVQQGVSAVQSGTPAMTSVKKPDGTAPSSMGVTVVLGGIGSCSATVQMYVALDAETPSAFGLPIVVTGGQVDLVPVSANSVINGPFSFIGALVTQISGTNANVTTRVGW